MAEIHDGGYAFPTGTFGGLSKRDYFAGQALVAIGDLVSFSDPNFTAATMRVIAKHCYAFADAMIAEREEDNG